MKEHPILFSGPMVRAILDGPKTQTRRVVTWANSTVDGQSAKPMWPQLDWTTAEWRETTTLDDAIYGPDAPSDPHIRIRNIDGDSWHRVRSKIEAGDKLWVRETWAWSGVTKTTDSSDTWYRATHYKGEDCGIRWRPSIHMPRWASRITLEVTGVRAERVGDISEADARAEGITDGGCLNCGESEPCGCASPEPSARDSFAWLWQNINGEYSWHANPWVWVIEFKREVTR